MEEKNYEKLILNNNVLTESNNQLVKANYEAINLLKLLERDNEILKNICNHIYQSLSSKKGRSLNEECWFLGLEKTLHKI